MLKSLNKPDKVTCYFCDLIKIHHNQEYGPAANTLENPIVAFIKMIKLLHYLYKPYKLFIDYSISLDKEFDIQGLFL